MLEKPVKGLVYSLANYTMIDKKDGKEKGMLNIHFIYQNEYETRDREGWLESQTWIAYDPNLYKELKALLLKNVEITYKLVPDYKDSTRFTAKVVKINDLVLKQ